MLFFLLQFPVDHELLVRVVDPIDEVVDDELQAGTVGGIDHLGEGPESRCSAFSAGGGVLLLESCELGET